MGSIKVGCSAVVQAKNDSIIREISFMINPKSPIHWRIKMVLIGYVVLNGKKI